MASSFWTEETVAEARRLYEEHYSASQTAAQISEKFGHRVTRNAVIGIWHRRDIMGYGKRPKIRAPDSIRRPRERKIRAGRSGLPALQIVQDEHDVQPRASVDVVPRNVPLLDLLHGECKYPYGDGRRDPYTFCGCPALDNMPYCEPHMRACSERSMTKTERREAAQLRRALETRGFARPTVAA